MSLTEKTISPLGLNFITVLSMVFFFLFYIFYLVVQKIDGPEARIADCFDVIAGTSTAGLVTTMLTAPNENQRPMYATKDIKAFYFDNGPKIFQDR